MLIFVSERNQQQLRDRGGVEVLIELLTQEQVLNQDKSNFIYIVTVTIKVSKVFFVFI